MTARAATRRVLAAAGLLCAVLAVAAAAAGLWLRSRMIAGLPRLDGSTPLPGLASPVRISRDALGVPTVEGSSRIDVARAMGWLHAQDRFFQMDLLRRRGAGELSELFGRAALPLDRAARMHGFRRLAQQVLARESPARRALIEAYAQGVNAGLAALGSKPWEYIVLRAEPRPWRPEDCALITYAMTIDLQDGAGRYVRTLSAIRGELGPASLAFFAPASVPGDAPLDGSSSREAPIPPASEVDLRSRESGGGAGMARSEALQDGAGRYVRTLSAIRGELGPASLAFFAPASVPGDAPLDGSSSREAPIPPASEVDLRSRESGGGAGMARSEAPGSAGWSDRETAG